MKIATIALASIALAACQSVPNVQPPMLLQDKPMIVVRHNGGLQDGACPMWVKVDGILKGQIERSQTLTIDVEPGIRTVTLGRSASGIFGAGTICSGSLDTKALVTRDIEVRNKPVPLVYEMDGVGKRWIPIAGLFLAPTPMLVPDEGQN